MKKLSNKGFMLIEVLVVSVFIATVLVVLFVQFKKINKSYNVSFNYNTVEDLYLLDNIKKLIINNPNSNNFGTYQSEVSDSQKYILIYNSKEDNNICPGLQYDCELLKTSDIDILYFARNDARDSMLKDTNILIEFKDYIKYMSFKAYNTDYFLVAKFNDGTYGSVNI